jgi:replicative DNA helicase
MNIPKDTQAEHSVIGCIILDNSLWDRVSSLAPTMFLDAGARLSFIAIREMLDAEQVVDAVTLSSHLNGKVTRTIISSYADAPGSSSMIEHYATIVRNKWLAREALRFAADTVEQEEIDLAEHINRAEIHLEQLKSGLAVSDIDIEQFSIRKGMSPLLKELECALPKGFLVPFPLPKVNDALGGGAVPGSVIFLAGSAKAGKTTLACQFIRGVSGADIPCAYFSFEQNDTELLRTMLGQEANVPGFVLRNRNLSAADWNRVIPAANILSGLKILLVAGRHTDPIRFWAQAEKCAGKGYRVLVIDHLQLLAEVGERDQGYAFKIKAITRKLKLFALKHQLVLLVLAQLQDKMDGGRLAMWGGASPMQDGDAVIVYLRPSQVNPNCKDPDSVFLYLNRLPGGQRPDVPVVWDAQSNTVKEIGILHTYIDDSRRYGND